jgi:hypothetical protein
MSLLQAELLSYLPFKRKTTTSGWMSFDAPCCIHNGESQDTRQRGGFISHNTGGFTYHCFNCGFKTSWLPGRQISIKNRKFFRWINVPDTKINDWSLEALKLLDSDQKIKLENKEFVEKLLPPDTLPLVEALKTHDDSIACLEYILDRGFNLEDYDWQYCPLSGYKDRVIVPFYHNKKLVGYTARKVVDGSPKYLSEAQSGYVFNIDAQSYKNKFVLVTEGPFDSLAVRGVGLLTNIPNDQQAAIINSLGKTVIVVPDRDYPGMQLVKYAMNNGWLVAIPNWEDDVKDPAKAVERYGRLFVLKDIIDTATDSKIRIELFMKRYPKEENKEVK